MNINMDINENIQSVGAENKVRQEHKFIHGTKNVIHKFEIFDTRLHNKYL